MNETRLIENEKKEEQVNNNENNENIMVNDASFNVIHKPHEIKNMDKEKEKEKNKLNIFSNVNNELCMEYLLKQSCNTFEELFNPKFEKNRKIPVQILNDAKGIIFLSAYKGGIGIGGQLGNGIIIARDPSFRKNWSGPCAVGIAGIQFGFNIGFEKTDHVVIIRDKEVMNKIHNGISLGGDISIVVGPLGQDTNLGFNLNEKGAFPNVYYSISKGMYLSVSLEGSIITIRNDCNIKYYGQDFDVLQILNGSVTAPFNSDYNTLCQLLDNYIQCKENFNNQNSTTTTAVTNITLPNENNPNLSHVPYTSTISNK